MDRRTREIERHWIESRDINDHATLLHCLVRNGLLEKRRVICAGFFGHKASRLMLPEEIKRHKVIVAAKTLHTEELNDFLFNIFHWPRDIYLRAILAVSKLSIEHLLSANVIHDIEVINRHLKHYIHDKNIKEGLDTVLPRRHSWFMYVTGLSYNDRRPTIIRNLSSLLGSILLKNSTLHYLQRLGANFEDEIFRKAIADEVIPYLLGEWK